MTEATGDDILAAVGVGPSALVGAGAQSRVYAIDEARVLRVLRNRGDVTTLARLRAFLAEIEGRLPVATPRIDIIDAAGRYTIERRLAGVSMLTLMPTLERQRRQRLLAEYVTAAAAPAAVSFPDQPYGEILAPTPIRAATWTGYLGRSLDRWLSRNRAGIAAAVGDVEGLRAKALTLLDQVEARPRKALVHGDYFPGNVIVGDDLSVSAIVDFSVFTVVGDPLYDVICAPIFLEMIEEATPDDVATARRLVLARHGEAVRPAAGFYRAHAAFAMADPANDAPPYPRLYGWAIATLRQLAAGGWHF